jgi:hypothetical protein
MSDILEYAAWKEFINSVDTCQNISDAGYKNVLAAKAQLTNYTTAKSGVGVGGSTDRTTFVADSCCPKMVQDWNTYIKPNIRNETSTQPLPNGFKVCDTSGFFRCGASCNWVVPANVFRAQIQMWGAGGNTSGMCCCGGSPFGPSGAYYVLDMQVVPGETICMCAACAFCCYATQTQAERYNCFSGQGPGSGFPGGAFNAPQESSSTIQGFSSAASPANIITDGGNTFIKFCSVNAAGATVNGCTAALAGGGKSSFSAWNYDWQQISVPVDGTNRMCALTNTQTLGQQAIGEIPPVRAQCCTPTACSGWNFCWDSANDSVCVPHIFASGIGFGKFDNYTGQCNDNNRRCYYYTAGLNGIWPSIVIGYNTTADTGGLSFNDVVAGTGVPTSFTISPPVFGFENCTLCMPFIGCSGCFGTTNQCTGVGRWGSMGSPFVCSTSGQQFGPGFGGSPTYSCGGSGSACGDSGRMGMVCVSWNTGCWWI